MYSLRREQKAEWKKETSAQEDQGETRRVNPVEEPRGADQGRGPANAQQEHTCSCSGAEGHSVKVDES